MNPGGQQADRVESTAVPDASGTERRIRVLINPKSGVHGIGIGLLKAFEKHWTAPDADLTYQLSRSVEDGRRKTLHAVREGVDSVIAVGGDGMVNTVGSILAKTPVSLGVVPAGSGNGFARHFAVPLEWEDAVRSLATAQPQSIDVGTANGRPFFVTCSMAADAAIIKTFEKLPVRGILPYVLAAAYGWFEYVPQPFEVVLDGGAPMAFPDPLVFTVANLTQFGGGAKIAPKACPDDGFLELVVIPRTEAPRLLGSLNRIFDGTLDEMPEVHSYRFQHMIVRRAKAAPIQVDGELVEAPAEVEISVLPRSLRVLVPAAPPPAALDAAPHGW